MGTSAIVTIIGMLIGLLGTIIGLLFKDSDKGVDFIKSSVVIGILVVLAGFGLFFIEDNPRFIM